MAIFARLVLLLFSVCSLTPLGFAVGAFLAGEGPPNERIFLGFLMGVLGAFLGVNVGKELGNIVAGDARKD